MNENIRVTTLNEKFTHWFPLYFGKEKDKFLNMAQKSVSMIYTQNTKKF